MSTDEDLDRLVCFCHHVTRRQINEAIQQGAKTIAEIQDKTLASTGCGGCQVDVEEILSQVQRA